MAWIPTWQNIAYSDRFRTSDPATQEQIRRDWLKEVAPSLYPQALTSFLGTIALTTQTYQDVLPNKLPDEDTIIKPNSLSMDNFATLENNPAFGKKNLGEQLTYRQIWLKKMANSDPGFQQLTPEEQQKFSEDFMTRYPSTYGMEWAGNTVGMNYDKQQIQDSWRSLTKSNQLAAQFVSYGEQFTNGFVEGATSLITGPLIALSKAAFGDYNDFAAFFENSDKAAQWRAYVSKADSWVPGFIGNMVGMAMGGFPKLDALLGGSMKIAGAGPKAIQVVSKAGLLEQVGTKIVGKAIPSFAYQVAGSTVAGGLQGIAQAMRENKPWDSYLAQDATAGVAFSLLGRWLGVLGETRRAMSESGFKGKVGGLFTEAFEPGKAHEFTPEYVKILKGDPRYQQLMNMKGVIDKNGFYEQAFDTEPVVKIRADIGGFDLKTSPEKIDILRKGTNEVVGSYANGQPNSWFNVSQWLIQKVDGFDNLHVKPIGEQFGMAPKVEIREVQYVPEKGREVVLNFLKDRGDVKGFDYTLDPMHDTTQVDKMIDVVRNHSTAKSISYLNSLGIKLGIEGETLRERTANAHAEVLELKSKLSELYPENASIMVDSSTGKIINGSDVPSIFLEHPGVKEPFYSVGIYAGTAQEARELMGKIKKVQAQSPFVRNIMFRNKNVEFSRIADNHVIQLKMKVPDEAGVLIDTTFQFSNLKKAQQFLAGGTKQSIELALQSSPELRESVDSFRKGLGRKGLAQYKNDYLPFVYLSKQAREQGFFMGNFKGNYVIQDIMTDAKQPKFHSFKTLQEVSDWLKVNDARKMMPNAIDISPETLEAIGLTDVDPTNLEAFHKLPVETQDMKKSFTLREYVASKLMTPSAQMEMFEKHPIAQTLREKTGKGPVDFLNDGRKVQRTAELWANGQKVVGMGMTKGMKQAHAEGINRLLQAVNTLEEAQGNEWLRTAMEHGYQPEIYKDVIDDLTEAFGTAKTEQMVNIAKKMRVEYDNIFGLMGLDPEKYIKAYSPWLAMELNRRGVSMAEKVDIHELMGSSIPKTDRAGFYRFSRGIDFKELAYEKNAFKLMNSYIDMAARERFIQPFLGEVKDQLKKVPGILTKAEGPADRMAFTKTMQDMFSTFMGVHGMDENIFKMAGQATIDGLKAKFNQPITRNAFDVIGKMLSSATGSYLAFRPFSVFKNLTQSLLTGAPLIGEGYWARGMARTLQPNALQELMKIGIIDPSLLPQGGGFAVGNSSIMDKAVQVGMAPFKGADWINRGAIYYGMLERFDDNATLLAKYGSSYEARFLRESGMKFFGKAQYNYMKKIMDTRPLNDALATIRDHVANLAVDKTQFLYDKWSHPAAFRNGIGRMFGQFIVWPVNYLTLMSDVFTSETLTTAQKAHYYASSVYLAGAVATGLSAVGIKSNSFLPWNSVLFQGGPYYQMMNDLLGSMSGGPESNGQYRSFVHALVGLVPFSSAGSALWNAVDSFSRGDMWEGALRLMSAPIELSNHTHKPDTPLNELEKILLNAGKTAAAGKDTLDTAMTSGFGLFGK
jgi:hypothetical protein